MDNVRAIEILRDLSNGVNPLTGELLPDKCVCNQAEVVRAFYCILNELSRQQNKPTNALPENAGKPWSKNDDEVSAKMFDRRTPRKEIGNYFKRTDGAIAARLVRIGKIESTDQFRKID